MNENPNASLEGLNNPQKGGAEVVTGTYLSFLAKKGHSVGAVTAATRAA